jgi:hypothetical protein
MLPVTDDVGYDTVTNSIGLTVPVGMVWGYFRKILRKFLAILSPNLRKILRKSYVGPLSLPDSDPFFTYVTQRLILACL